jgi:hypothetical protein
MNDLIPEMVYVYVVGETQQSASRENGKVRKGHNWIHN